MLARIGFTRGVLVQPSIHGTDNRAMLAALARHPGTYRGVANVPAGLPASELAVLHAAGVRGVRFQNAGEGSRGLRSSGHFAALEAVAAQTHELGWHVLVHLWNGSQLADVVPVLERIRNPFVLDHMARLRPAENGVNSAPFRLLLRLLENGRAYVKLASLYRLSAQPYPYRDWLPMIEAVVKTRPDRVVWGSNFPHPRTRDIVMPDDGDLADLIPLWIPDPADQRRVLVENPARLYDFPSV
jgi:predicted TIM-barrel fold metal-dependent hydrolase